MNPQLPADFADFISPEADRFSVLSALLSRRGLCAKPAEIAGNKHLIVSPEKGTRKPRTVLVAHYDRAEGSPGANDNGAAVFILAEAARRLSERESRGWLAVFTDREECAAEDGAHAQGAYGLAQGFKAIGLADADFFIFDACGRGDTIVLSTTVDLLLSESAGGAERSIRNKRDLRRRALEAGRRVHSPKMMLAPTPFSDDAGFLAAGLAAQTITVLPQEEASALAREIRINGDYARALISREARTLVPDHALRSFYPRTWSLMHGPGDGGETLTPEMFSAVERFAVDLAENS